MLGLEPEQQIPFQSLYSSDSLACSHASRTNGRIKGQAGGRRTSKFERKGATNFGETSDDPSKSVAHDRLGFRDEPRGGPQPAPLATATAASAGLAMGGEARAGASEWGLLGCG